MFTLTASFFKFIIVENGEVITASPLFFIMSARLYGISRISGIIMQFVIVLYDHVNVKYRILTSIFICDIIKERLKQSGAESMRQVHDLKSGTFNGKERFYEIHTRYGSKRWDGKGGR
jgi:hypothetical protein